VISKPEDDVEKKNDEIITIEAPIKVLKI